MAQELELTTNNVQVYARVKNCIDFYLCSPYEETLNIDNGYYRWKVQFKEPLSKIQTAFDECNVGKIAFDITIRDELGVVRKDFNISRSPFTPAMELYLTPMELYPRTYEGFKYKEKNIKTLLENKAPLPAMKSTTFEMEYPLGEYQLLSYPLDPGVLAITHHVKKIVVYDMDKWDGSVCRFYEVMRHETQHVRNRRKQLACKGKHHFRAGNNDERATYLNDLVFLKNYCPDEKALYKNVEAMLLRMYQNKKVQPCGVGEGNSPDMTGTSSGSDGKPADSEKKSPVKGPISHSTHAGHTHKPIYRSKLIRRPNRPAPQANPNNLN